MDILRFTPVSGNYAIIIRTDDESRSWRRFRSRIDADGGNRAGRYCTYTSSDSGVLQLYSHDTGELEQLLDLFPVTSKSHGKLGEMISRLERSEFTRFWP